MSNKNSQPNFDHVFHVGELSRLKNQRPFKVGHSLEGGELSVSHHPEAWIRIAKLWGIANF